MLEDKYNWGGVGGVGLVVSAFFAAPQLDSQRLSSCLPSPGCLASWLLLMSLSSSSFVLGRLSGGTSETPTACFLHSSFSVPGRLAGAPFRATRDKTKNPG